GEMRRSGPALGLQLLPTLVEALDLPLRLLQGPAGFRQGDVASPCRLLYHGLALGHHSLGGEGGGLHPVPLLLLALPQLPRRRRRGRRRWARLSFRLAVRGPRRR